ncbi:MAG: hypothetical protein HC913_21975 [Microscillaceae bacterium]|nr:hypothetical protein [Microscillaceae bacterium]
MCASKAEETEFKSLLSLVPGMYGDNFEKLKTQGTLAFSGWAKGPVKAGKWPAFQMDLQVKDGGFQYPDLPEGVSNVQIALQLENKDGKWQNTRLDLSRLHAEVGKNVADAQVRFSKLYDGEVQGKANAQLKLEDLTRVFPLSDFQLKGLFSLKARAKGRYNATQRPVMEAEVRLANGFVKSKAYPKAIEQLQLEARAENPTGRPADAKIALDKFQFSLDGEKVEGRATFQNAEDWQYAWQLKGQLDLAKLAQIYPSGGATLKGKVKGNIEASGRVSALKTQQYAKLPTSGNIQLQDFYYAHPQNLPSGLGIQAAQASFDPEKISLESMKGNLGKSDFALEGEVRHYLAYLLTGETLKGQLNFQSKKVDLSEWTSTNARGEREAVPLPQAIDFTIQASIAEVLYPKIPVRDFRGMLRLREGTLQMENVRFAALGGAFVMSGQYNPADRYRPRYQFDFDMQNLDIASAHEAFVERKNNLRQNIKGQLSARAQLRGFLGPDLAPLYDENMGGSFSVKIPQAQMKRLSIAQSANKHLKLDDTEEMILRNLDMQATIREGKVYYTPFEFNLNEYRIAMQGNNSLAGVLDLALKIVIPKSKMSPVAEVAIAALTRQKLIGVKEMAIDFLVRGTYPNHEITPLRSDGKEIQVKNEKLKQKIDEKRAERREEMRENMQNLNKSPEEVLADAQTKAAEIRAQALREATQIETEADSLAQTEIAAAASKGKVAREMAERQANMRKKTAYRRAELRRQQGEREAQKTLQNAQLIADRMRQE